MNPLLFKKFVKLAIGALVGGTIGYFVGGLIVYKIEALELEKELEEMVDEENMEDKFKEISSELLEKAAHADSPENEEVEESKEKKRNRHKKNKKITPYEQFSKNKGDISTLANLAEQYQTSIVREVSVSEDKKVYKYTFITRDDYESSKGSVEKESLMYYEEDDVLTSMDGKTIDNPEKLIGPDALVHFGLGSGDPDIVYIHNEDNDVYYEVIRLHKSYQKEILGIEPEEKKPKKKVNNVDEDREPDKQ